MVLPLMVNMKMYLMAWMNYWTEDSIVYAIVLHLLFRDVHTGTGLILGLCPASEGQSNFVTTFLIGWVQACNQSCGITLIGTIYIFLSRTNHIW